MGHTGVLGIPVVNTERFWLIGPIPNMFSAVIAKR